MCLLALPAGTLADAMDRRKLLIVVQVAMLLVAALLGVLVLGGWAGARTLLAVTFALGTGTAIMSPTWQAIIPRLVPREQLQQAVALHAVGINISRAIGPAIGGLVIVSLGLAWPFLINSLSFLAVVGALWWWRAPPQAQGSPREAFVAAMRTGLSHVPQNTGLRNTLWRSVLFFGFSSAYWACCPWLPARSCMAAPTCSAFWSPASAPVPSPVPWCCPKYRARWGLDRLVMLGTVGTALAMTAFACLHAAALGLIAAALAGASWIASLSSLNVAAQLSLPDWVRARGMGLYTSVFYGSLALGSVLWGQIATRVGIPQALLIAAAGAVVALLPARRLPLGR